ncbi:MAG: Holliday junction resolvase RuvX [Bacteroidota bacterium]
MSRIIAIDYGTKRCGLAESDDLKMIASPLQTLSPGELFPFLENYHKKYTVELFVLGDPKRWDGTASSVSSEIESFCRRLKEKFPGIAIEKTDERFSSVMATDALLAAGAKKKTRADKSNIDKVSAAIILQSYLGRRK